VISCFRCLATANKTHQSFVRPIGAKDVIKIVTVNYKEKYFSAWLSTTQM